MKKLVLLRHGESTWNQENRFTGWTDVGLTDKGLSEARAAGQLLIASVGERAPESVGVFPSIGFSMLAIVLVGELKIDGIAHGKGHYWERWPHLIQRAVNRESRRCENCVKPPLRVLRPG